MSEPRELTRDEVKQQFIEHARHLVDYWSTIDLQRGPLTPEQNIRERVEGAMFSLLAAIDGCAGGLPAFMLVPMPHPSDKEYYQKEGSNWYPDPPEHDDICDIAGGLHEILHVRK